MVDPAIGPKILTSNVLPLPLSSSLTTIDLPYQNEHKLVEFNCFGTIFLIREISLNRFPNTVLGDPQRRATFYNKNKQQYIIDRHIPSFEAIINFYETGKLITPATYESIIFYEELKYFKLDNETLGRFYNSEISGEFINDRRVVPYNRIMRAIWISLEFSDYSFITQIIQLVCLLVSLLYVFNITVELIPQFSRNTTICFRPVINQKLTDCDSFFYDFRPSKSAGSWIYNIEIACTTFITFECLIRFIASPHKWATLCALINLIDMCILVAGWTYIVLIETRIFSHDTDPFFYIKFYQHLIVIRLLRLFRLCRYVKSLRIVLRGAEKACREIVSIGFILLLFVFTFGVIIQLFEKNWDHGHVTRVEDLFNIVSISTITVGDAKRVPLSPAGKTFCAFLATIGIVGISLPLPLIYQTFQAIYRLENMERRFITTKYIYPNGKPVR